MMTPLVAQANDDNGDGIIDIADTPDIIFSAHSRNTARGGEAPGIVRIISGANGEEINSFTDAGAVVEAYGSLAVGDIDNDGEIEIVAPGFANGVYAFELDGSIKWYQPNIPKIFYGGAAIADVDGDGQVEIAAGGALLDANTGNIIWQGNVFEGQFGSGTGVLYRGSLPVVADINLDGMSEVIYGGTVYNIDGNVLWQNADTPDGLSGIGNFDNDDFAEVVIVRNGFITLADHTGETIWRVVKPDGGEGGAPTIADYDADGEPEIGVAGSTTYTVFDTDGSVLWETATFDTSSRNTGSSVFDFNNDGVPEVVYADERNIHIFDGLTGNSVFELPHSSATTYEYPVIADVDNDGHAEIVVAQNDVFRPGSTPFNGIRVFEEENYSLVDTRGIWNQHAYSIDNVNDDGSIPTNPVKSWLTHNTFRLNAFPQCSAGDPVQKWNWKSSGAVEDVYGPVTVGQVTDDNGDGVINQNDSPDIIFVSSVGTGRGTLNAIDGDTGEQIWRNESITVSGWGSPAIADIDGDGIIEIVIPNNNRTQLYAFEHTGELKWQVASTPTFNGVPRDAVAFADLDQDGTPEIVHGRRVHNADGSLRWEGEAGRGDNQTYGFLPSVADIDLDGSPDVIAGKTVYNFDGSLKWDRSDIPGDGYNAIGNLDSDDFAEIVVVENGAVVALEHDGSTKWGPIGLPGGGVGGAPTLADLDGDGEAEIGVAGGSSYVGFELRATQVLAGLGRQFLILTMMER